MNPLILSADIRSARLEVIHSKLGALPTLEFYSTEGALLATGKLPGVWLAIARDGTVQKSGDWGVKANAEGLIGSFRIVNSRGSEMRGRVTLAAGGGPMIVDMLQTKRNYTIYVRTFMLVEGNA